MQADTSEILLAQKKTRIIMNEGELALWESGTQNRTQVQILWLFVLDEIMPKLHFFKHLSLVFTYKEKNILSFGLYWILKLRN